MTNRVTRDQVRDIIDTSLSDVQIEAFITTAHRMIEEASTGLGASILTEIEKYLAAHLLTLRDQRVESESFPTGVRFKYQGQTGMGLESTHYGQMVKVMDTSGKIASLGKPRPTFDVFSEED